MTQKLLEKQLPESYLLADLSTKLPLPALWLHFMDVIVPQFTKKHYIQPPKVSHKPFSTQDARFFTASIIDLSDQFRHKDMLSRYADHPRYRSAYLLYFLPLQAAKFSMLFSKYTKLLASFQSPSFHLADVGCGPGSASIAYLLWLGDHPQLWKKTQELEFSLIDWNYHFLNHAKELIQMLCDILGEHHEHTPKIKINLLQGHWQQKIVKLPPNISLSLLGNILNEYDQNNLHKHLQTLYSKTSGSLLFLEPATAQSFEILGQIREHTITPPHSMYIYGPCLHSKACPLWHAKEHSDKEPSKNKKHYKDWCHFSTPVDKMGTWFTAFSKALGSERTWLKYSFLWIGTQPTQNMQAQRIISDPLFAKTNPSAKTASVIVCEPETPRHLKLHKNKLLRGSILENIPTPKGRSVP